ncbi:hypothetical protein M0812_18203 [Anaeramoeba flamelloides]|uniref:Uncharacterized protein n=1 Tax=Anaeramoeba flamelloides TaxID=1746091 RepID=A0AAV7Z5A2_9EUKA|nr:hypothetical protein M0812_18203 [Anaeramoeba flamelloides]
MSNQKSSFLKVKIKSLLFLDELYSTIPVVLSIQLGSYIKRFGLNPFKPENIVIKVPNPFRVLLFEIRSKDIHNNELAFFEQELVLLKDGLNHILEVKLKERNTVNNIAKISLELKLNQNEVVSRLFTAWTLLKHKRFRETIKECNKCILKEQNSIDFLLTTIAIRSFAYLCSNNFVKSLDDIQLILEHLPNWTEVIIFFHFFSLFFSFNNFCPRSQSLLFKFSF